MSFIKASCRERKGRWRRLHDAMYDEGYVPEVIESHLSHIGGQQGLQFLDDKQTQGADRVKQLLQRGSADYHL